MSHACVQGLLEDPVKAPFGDLSKAKLHEVRSKLMLAIAAGKNPGDERYNSCARYVLYRAIYKRMTPVRMLGGWLPYYYQHLYFYTVPRHVQFVGSQ